eukprot:COSAG01_NODE_31163_length_602_cov_4.200795_2_plen_86_part_01
MAIILNMKVFLVTFVGAFEHFMSITRSADRRLGGTKKHRAAVVKQAMAYESEDFTQDDDNGVVELDQDVEWNQIQPHVRPTQRAQS